MYKELEPFHPIDNDCKIWRFMDFAKFCNLLETGSLFFVRPKNFKDPWEGYLPKKHFEESSYADLPENVRSVLIESAKIRTPNLVRESFAVNCWHISDYESEAFWRNYSERGIVIQTTFGKLKDSFKNESNYSIYIGEVEYKDHEIDVGNDGNLFYSILWKRKSFEYEQELRAVIWELENTDAKVARPFDDVNGQNIKVDVDILIENLYTTPFEKGDWFNNTVNDTLKRYNIKVKSMKSSLMDNPVN